MPRFITLHNVDEQQAEFVNTDNIIRMFAAHPWYQKGIGAIIEFAGRPTGMLYHARETPEEITSLAQRGSP